MIISTLTLRNFRNFAEISFHFSPLANGFIGGNGHGKTNILEALYMLAAGSRWRGDADGDLVRFGAHYCVVDGVCCDDSSHFSLRFYIELHSASHSARKRYFVNGVSRSLMSYSSSIAAVLFHPDDIGIIYGSPAQRRSLLDECLSQAHPYYRRLLSQYLRVIASRNKVLEQIREGSAHLHQLEYWTESMIHLGSELLVYRHSFFDFLRTSLVDFTIRYYPHISGDFSSSTPNLATHIAEVYRLRVEQNVHKEILSATSHYGPHKDDYSFFLGDRDIGRFGSRGEQRAAFFYFKKAHVLYIEHVRTIKPILLLDDIFSEFDHDFRVRIADLCRGYQTFVTGTDLSYFQTHTFAFQRLFRVTHGSVSVIV